jgi:transposase
MTTHYWIGVDLAKDSFHAALAREHSKTEQWKKLPQKSFEHSPGGLTAFAEWVHAQGVTLEQVAGVCVESTGNLSWRWLFALDQRLGNVSIVNPYFIKTFGQSMRMRNKTDRIDAAVIALYGLQREPAPTAIPSQAERQLRKLHRLYGALEKDRTAHKNRLLEVGEDQLVRTHIEEIVADLNSHIERIEKEMDQLIQSDKVLSNDYKILKTIKGIGLKTARLLLAELGDMRKFSRKQVVAFTGLYPKLFQSGSSVNKKTRLAKGGGAILRRNLYWAAMAAKKHNPKLKIFFNRLVERGHTKKSAVVAVMRKLILIARAVVVSGKNFNPDMV